MISSFILNILILLLPTFSAPAANCEVLLESIAGNYDGDCKKKLAEGSGTARGTDTYVGEFKKGLPDGQGRYIWKNGNYYSGDFVKGLRDGYGELTIKREGKKDSLVIGYWVRDNFIGASNAPYRETHSSNIKNITFEKVAEVGAEIMVVCQRGKEAVVPEGLRFSNDQEIKPLSEYSYNVLRKIDFPFTGAKMDFRSQASTGTAVSEYHVEFDIFEKGRWLVTIELY